MAGLAGDQARLLSLAGGVVLDLSPTEAVAVAARAGYGALGLRLAGGSLAPDDLATIRGGIDAAGLALLDVEWVRLTPDGRFDDGNRRLLEVAAMLGARHLLCVSLDEDAGRTAASLVGLAEAARGTGVVPVLEFMRFSAVRSFAEASEVLARADHPDLGILVDALHLDRGGESPQVLLGSGLVRYAQLCDAPARPPASDDATLGDEARTARLLPGDGELPLQELLEVLPPGLPLSLEVLSDRLVRSLPPLERAEAVLAATRRLLAEPPLSPRPAPAG
jgi:sugar phosphate isomerase/epimerase